MNSATRTAIQTLLAADPSVKPENVRVALEVLEGKGLAQAPAASPIRLFTVQEYADHWNCGVRTVFRWIESGQVKAIKRGRVVRIPVSEKDHSPTAQQGRKRENEY